MCNRDPSPRPSSSSNWEEGEMTKRRPGAFCPHKRSQYVEAPTHKESMCGGSSTKGINMWRLLHKWNQYVEAPSTNGIGVNMWRLPPQMESICGRLSSFFPVSSGYNTNAITIQYEFLPSSLPPRQIVLQSNRKRYTPRVQ